MNISAVIITKNEEKNLKRCLESLNFVDEIIVVDDNSNDNTLEIAEKFKTRIFKRNLDNDFSSQRNLGLAKANGKWVLFIDADEVIPISLKNEIIQTIVDPLNQNMGYFLKRKDFIYRKSLNGGEWANIKLLRLVRKNSGKWTRAVHEKLVVEGKVGCLKSELIHFPHQNLNEFIKSINNFSSIHANSNFVEGKKSTIFKILFFPVAKLFQNWIIKKGYKDGNLGFIISLVISFHSFLGWAKLWLQKRN